jgi:hypothetical protein
MSDNILTSDYDLSIYLWIINKLPKAPRPQHQKNQCGRFGTSQGNVILISMAGKVFEVSRVFVYNSLHIHTKFLFDRGF